MSFSAELKDFVSGFKAGYSMSVENYKATKKSVAEKKWEKEEADDAEAKSVFEAGKRGVDPDAKVDTPQVRTPTFQQLEQNITAQESSGNYKAVGPTHPKLGRALGYAQVMEANLPEWSKAAVGRSVSADEFLNDEELQKKIVRHRLGGYYNQYGPEGAASMWFTGRPRPTGRRDSLGTVDHDYVRRAVTGKRAGLELDDEEEMPVVYAAEGGLIPRVQAGDTDHGGSNPAVRDAVENPDNLADFSVMPEFMDRGIRGVQRLFGLDQPAGIAEADPRRQQGMEAYAKNAMAPDPAEIEEMKNTVDPDKKMRNEEVRTVAGWSALYKYHRDKGNEAGANKAAIAMFMHAKRAAQLGGTMAQAAAEKGDLEGAAQAVAQGYSALPDGKRLEVKGKTKNGVKFSLYDEETGELSSEGEANIDQIMKIATGMQNGTEFFRAAGALAQKKVDKVKVRNEEERAALEKFSRSSGKGVIGEFRAGLEDDEARADFDALPASRQMQIAQAEAQKDRAEAERQGRQSRFDIRREDNAWKEAIKQDRWEKDRERMMTRDELAASQRQQDLDDRNSRFDQSQEARKARQKQHDEEQLAKRERTGTGRAGPSTAGERADQAVRSELQTGLGALDIESQNQIKRATAGKADTELGDADVAAAEGIRGERDVRKGGLVAGSAFNQMTNDPSRKFNQATAGAVPEAIKSAWDARATGPDGTVRPDHKPPTRAEANLLTDIATDIVRGDFTPERAADLAIEATTPGAKVRLGRDGSVQVGDQPPFKVSERNYLQIARLQGRASKPIPAPGNPEGKKKTTAAVDPDMKGSSPTGNVSDPVRPHVADRPGLFSRLREGAQEFLGTRPIDKFAVEVPEVGGAQPEWREPRRAWRDPQPDWRDPPRRWVDPPAHAATTSSKYDRNPARKRKELRQARRQGVPI